MMIRILAICGAALLITGCGDLLSLHTLYTEKDQALDPTVEGRWETKDDALLVERAASGYLMTLHPKKEPSHSSEFEVHLVDIGGVRFADILPRDAIGHMFARVRVTGDQMRIAFLDSKWLRGQVPHDEADMSGGQKQAVLTAHTPELRKLVAKYASEPKAYDEEMSFRRTK